MSMRCAIIFSEGRSTGTAEFGIDRRTVRMATIVTIQNVTT